MSMTFHSSIHPSSGFIILECQTVSGNTIQESHCNSHMTATCLRKVFGGGSPMHHTIHTFFQPKVSCTKEFDTSWEFGLELDKIKL